ncbi:hypothetical protein AB1Y20_018645 [Prymnesium parvum]|uniref:Uncharacterized protein n=1 Tax=Prymnesium parvum TaxID=97485 RepID=A0AB34JQG9_PRYPA
MLPERTSCTAHSVAHIAHLQSHEPSGCLTDAAQSSTSSRARTGRHNQLLPFTAWQQRLQPPLSRPFATASPPPPPSLLHPGVRLPPAREGSRLCSRAPESPLRQLRSQPHVCIFDALLEAPTPQPYSLLSCNARRTPRRT